MKRAVPTAILIVSAMLCSMWLVACGSRVISRQELDDSAARIGLKLKTGMDIGEIGAGDGTMTIVVANAVGASGHVYSTEIDANKIARIREKIQKAGLVNVSVIQAGEADTNLAANCCDAIFMTAVYHHFTHPNETDAGIFRALRPGGILAIQDFRPTMWLAPWTPAGVPANRGGHGIPESVLRFEVTAAGFQETRFTDKCPADLFRHYYCVDFQKPATPSSATTLPDRR
jgi:ubiquinone/menaquinone biosynthesis C-methylase UbiE